MGGPRTRFFRKVYGNFLTEKGGTPPPPLTDDPLPKTLFLGQFLMDFFLTESGGTQSSCLESLKGESGLMTLGNLSCFKGRLPIKSKIYFILHKCTYMLHVQDFLGTSTFPTTPFQWNGDQQSSSQSVYLCIFGIILFQH